MDLLEVRRKVKARKPNFKIQNSNDPKKRFAGRWKRPKGLQNKMRERRKGNPKYIEPGYGSPVAVKGANPDGAFPVVVASKASLSSVKQGMSVVIAASVGLRSRIEIVKAALDRKLRLSFDGQAFLAKSAQALEARKKRRQELKGKAQPAPVVQEQPKPAVDDEEKKKAEKAEKDKILTKAK